MISNGSLLVPAFAIGSFGMPFRAQLGGQEVCHARFGPRLISVRPDQKRLPEIVRLDNFRCSILSHHAFFGPM